MPEPVAIGGDSLEHIVPADPKLYATYDGAHGPPKPGDAAGGFMKGAENVVQKVEDAVRLSTPGCVPVGRRSAPGHRHATRAGVAPHEVV